MVFLVRVPGEQARRSNTPSRKTRINQMAADIVNRPKRTFWVRVDFAGNDLPTAAELAGWDARVVEVAVKRSGFLVDCLLNLLFRDRRALQRVL
jgi:hypothetical protein